MHWCAVVCAGTVCAASLSELCHFLRSLQLLSCDCQALHLHVVHPVVIQWSLQSKGQPKDRKRSHHVPPPRNARPRVLLCAATHIGIIHPSVERRYVVLRAVQRALVARERLRCEVLHLGCPCQAFVTLGWGLNTNTQKSAKLEREALLEHQLRQLWEHC